MTIYSKDYGHALGAVLSDGYQNDTDTMTDYFDKGRVVLFADHPLYAAALAAALAAANRANAAWDARQEKRAAKYAAA